MPYREPAALARYPIHSARGARLALVAGGALAVGGPLWLVAGTPVPVAAWLPGLALAALPGLAVLAAHAFSAEAHSVAGGNGEIVLYASHIVLPPPWGRRALSLPLHAVELGFTEIRGSINLIPVSNVEVLTISGNGRSRKLSSRLFDDRRALRRLALDIERVQAGQSLEPDDEAASESLQRSRGR